MKPFNLTLRILKIVSDYLLILASFAFAYFLRVGAMVSTEFPFWDYFMPAVWIGVPWLFVMYFARAYSLEQNVRNFRHFQRIVFANLVGISAYIITFFFLRKFLFSRLMIVYIFMFSIFLIWLCHYIYSCIERYYYAKGVGVYRTLIIGTNREAERLIELLKKESSIHMPVAVLDAHGTKNNAIAGVPVKGKLNKFENVIEEDRIEQIIQTDNLEQVINIMNYALKHNIRYALLPSLLGAYRKRQYIDELEGVPVVRIE